jgi:CIC family chloride channel protein
MRPPSPAPPASRVVADTFAAQNSLRFWIAVILTGVGTGLGAAFLYALFEWVQHLAWPGSGGLLQAATAASPWRRVLVLLAAGALTGIGQVVLAGLSSGNGIDINAAIWFTAGRLPVLRTLASAVLSIVVVGMGVSLGREGAPKQAGAVVGNLLADRAHLSDEQRRLLVACGAGAGMAAAYGVPLGGALFALEVLRGVLALRLVLPALVASVIATVVAWLAVPDTPIYVVPDYPISSSIIVWAVLLGPIAGVVSVGYVRAIAWADRHRPAGWARIATPVVVIGILGVASIWFPQLLGNGRDISELAFNGNVAPSVLLATLLLKPLATVFCVRSGAPGGLFTPSLALGAVLGGLVGHAWSLLWPGAPAGLYAIVGAAAVLAATTQGPISTVVLMIELTGHDRSFLVPLLIAVSVATFVSRRIEPRSIYDARLSDQEVEARLAARAPSAT